MQLRSDVTPNLIQSLLHPYIAASATVPSDLYTKLAMYLELLLKWNARTNLTAIRDTQAIVRRHFGESLFAAQHLPQCQTLLDFGSGAGFPGVPLQLFRPDLRVTLAESQNKKAAFLREVVRTLGLKTQVWPSRVEMMPAGLYFDVVTLRAVDDMDAAIAAAGLRVGERLILFTTSRQTAPVLSGFEVLPGIPIPNSEEQQLVCLDRTPDRVV